MKELGGTGNKAWKASRLILTGCLQVASMHDLMRVDGARNSWQTSVAVHTHERLMLQYCSYLYVAALLHCSIALHLSRGQNLSLASLPMHACMQVGVGVDALGCDSFRLALTAPHRHGNCVTPDSSLSLDTDECGVST